VIDPLNGIVERILEEQQYHPDADSSRVEINCELGSNCSSEREMTQTIDETKNEHDGMSVYVEGGCLTRRWRGRE